MSVLEAVRHRLSVTEFLRIAEVGVFAPDARIELIEGDMIDRVPIEVGHARMVTELVRLLYRMVPDAVIISPQNPLQLGERSLPQPDIQVLQPRADGYADRHPGPGDVYFLIEVADSTLDYDRQEKVPLYAAHGVVEVWLVDLWGRRVHVCRRPQPAERRYGEYMEMRDGGLAPLGPAGVVVDIARLFGA